MTNDKIQWRINSIPIASRQNVVMHESFSSKDISDETYKLIVDADLHGRHVMLYMNAVVRNDVCYFPDTIDA